MIEMIEMIEIDFWDFCGFLDATNPNEYVWPEWAEQLYAQMMGWA